MRKLIISLVLFGFLFNPEGFTINSGKKKKAAEQHYKIAVCDWMILKRQKLSAFKLSAELGADGLELDMGGLGNRPTFDCKLFDPVVRKQFLDEALKTNVQIASIAMSGFYAQPLYNREGIEKTIDDAINTLVLMNVKVAFLPLGVEGDLVKFPERRAEIVERLKMVGAKAEAAGVVIGIETALNATSEVVFLNEIGSPAIKSYFNFASALQNGRDLIQEIRILGKDRICQINCTDEDGVWLENNKRLDMPAVKKVLDEIGYRGWLVVERSRDAANPRDVKGNFTANVRYLKSVFQTK